MLLTKKFKIKVITEPPAESLTIPKRRSPVNQRLTGLICGERGIRTPGTSRYDGFQDRCNRPLYHLSWSRLRCKGKALWGKGKILCAYFVRGVCNYMPLHATKCNYMPLTETAAKTACSHYGFYNNCCSGNNYGHQHTAHSA